jgi:iron complex outermembrane receptor protein
MILCGLLGSKFEYNDYTGFEIQPTARVMWAPHHQHRLWAAVSRAVRTPSRLEYGTKNLGTVIPPQPPAIPVATTIFFEGNPQFESEHVISYEMGYRTILIDDVSIDFTAFYTNYSNLRSMQSSTPFFNLATGALEVSSVFSNNFKAQTYGLEVAAVWQMLDWWRWDANYSLLKTNTEGVDTENITSSSPQQHVSLRSSMTPWKNINLDILFRYVDSNEAVGFFGSTIIDEYVSLDIRLAWRPVNNLELSLVEQNLLAGQHLEYRQEAITTPTEIDRGMYGKLTWYF